MNGYTFAYRRYRRPLAVPLRTAHGEWRVREGLLIRLGDGAGGVGYGEMAPIPHFGTETLDDCEALCRALGPVVTDDELTGWALPCAQFAVGTALAMLGGALPPQRLFPVARLLPDGEQASADASTAVSQGFRVLKLKYRPGTGDLDTLRALLVSLRGTRTRLRIDANCGLDARGARDLMDVLAIHAQGVEFLEQPFPPGSEPEMLGLMARHGVPVALDESVASPAAFAEHMDWPGPLVVKPALMGNPLRLRERLRSRVGAVVLSSALETPIGLYGALLAAVAEEPALGFGVANWPAEDFRCIPLTGGHLDARLLTMEYLGQIWSHTGSS